MLTEQLKALRKGETSKEYLALLTKQLEALREKEETWHEYLDLLDIALVDAEQCSNTDEPSDWDTAIAICDACLGFFDGIAGIENHEPKFGIKRIRYWRKKGKKRKKWLRDEERYKGPDFLITKTLCKLKQEVIQKGKVIPGLLIHEKSIESTDLRKKVISKIKKMGREIKSFKVGNKPFLYDKLIEVYIDWKKVFERNAFLVKFIHYMELSSVMKFKWWWGLSLIRRGRIGGIGYLLSAFFRCIFWLVSGFGEKTERYILSIVVIIFFFGAVYSMIGEVKIQECGNIVWSLWDGLYFSVVTFTTLGFGDLYPCDSFCKLTAAVEVTIGYVMLDVLIQLITKKLEP